MAEYKPVTVEAARDVANHFAKDVIVIVAWERARNRVHTTTYGRLPADKLAAANLGEVLAKAAGCDLSQAQGYEDFRTRTAAEWAQEKDRLLAEIERLKTATGGK